MSGCEKCWADSRLRNIEYHDMIALREREGPICTPEEKAGPDATQCPMCKRMSLHQYTKEPMCGCEPKTEETT